MKNKLGRELIIKLVGGSVLRVAILAFLWFGFGFLVYNTGVGDFVRVFMQRFFQVNYFRVLDVLQTIYIPLFFIIMILLVYHPVIQAINYLQSLADSIDTLLRKDDTLIKLPPNLIELEYQLNNLKQGAVKSEQTAVQAEQRKNDLVVYLAHDIKSPLTSVIGYLSLLDEAPEMPAEQKAKYIGITLEKAYRLEQLVDEFFEITRFNLQSIVLNKETINLAFMLQQLADEFYPLLAPQGKQAVVEAADDLSLSGDPDKLSRVFNNILKNAAVYSHPNSVIAISAFLRGDKVIIAFANKGNPIPAEKLKTIFEKFFRLDTSRSSQTGGAGLGLAIAKEIVTAHGGDIAAESSEEQTVFTVALPAR